QSDADRRQYQPLWPLNTAGVALVYDGFGTSTPKRADPDQVERILAAHLPVSGSLVVQADTCSAPVQQPGTSCPAMLATVPAQNECPLAVPGSDSPPPSAAQVREAERTDWRCAPSIFSGQPFPGGTIVGDAEVARLFLGAMTPEAERTLAAGGVVTSDRHLLVDGQVTFVRQDTDPPGPGVRLPAALVPSNRSFAQLVESPQAARRLGQRVEDAALLVRLARIPTADEEDATRQALAAAGIEADLGIGRPYQDDYRLGLLALVIGAGIITLGASGIATGLAQADARADHATLAAVGAAPRLRRRLAGAQALTVAGLGTVLGIASGFVPAVALIAAIDRYRLVWPWTTLGEVLVGIPLLAGATAWLFTRSRAPLERRLAD
ncbi:MAG TPA: hypothetical protein VFS29_02575, partial [Motilibacteraceae bacterium]|nr:hypothetical protein [Motilibacteraceae bacterium]